MIYTDKRHRPHWVVPRLRRSIHTMEIRCSCGWYCKGEVLAGYMEKLLWRDFLDHMKPGRVPVDTVATRGGISYRRKT